MRVAFLPLFLAVAACGTATTGPPAEPPDAKTIILAHKNRLWKDADSIKGASITAPYRNIGQWHVCVRANAKNSYGAYAGEKENLIGLYEDGSPPEAIASDAPIRIEGSHAFS